MPNTLPTLQSAAWAMTGFLDAARELLQGDRAAKELRLYFYAVTNAGWRELAAGASAWMAARRGRGITAYVGTDHALTEPTALETMQNVGVAVRLLRRYNGVYHPKVIWFVEDGAGHLLVGSNNLTLDGLKSNIEFATLTRLVAPDASLQNWHATVHAASDPLAEELLSGYAREREAFGKARARAGVAGTFTWSKRASGGTPPATRATPTRRAPPVTPIPVPVSATATPEPGLGHPVVGDLIIEIMPLETGTGGSQVQIPMRAAESLFGLGNTPRARVAVSLRNVITSEDRELTMTRFSNATARLVIHELGYRDRPCVVVFRRTRARVFDFEIVRLSMIPDRYRRLLRLCRAPTRSGSRRWIQIQAPNTHTSRSRRHRRE